MPCVPTVFVSLGLKSEDSNIQRSQNTSRVSESIIIEMKAWLCCVLGYHHQPEHYVGTENVYISPVQCTTGVVSWL